MAGERGFWDWATEFDPTTPWDVLDNAVDEAGDTTREGIDAAEVIVPDAAGRVAAATGFFGALGVATVPLTATAAAGILYVAFVDPGLPARLLKRIRG